MSSGHSVLGNKITLPRAKSMSNGRGNLIGKVVYSLPTVKAEARLSNLAHVFVPYLVSFNKLGGAIKMFV